MASAKEQDKPKSNDDDKSGIIKYSIEISNDAKSQAVREIRVKPDECEDELLKQGSSDINGRTFIVQAFKCRMTSSEYHNLVPMNKPIARVVVFEKGIKQFTVWYQYNKPDVSHYYSYDLYMAGEQLTLGIEKQMENHPTYMRRINMFVLQVLNEMTEQSNDGNPDDGEDCDEVTVEKDTNSTERSNQSAHKP